MNQLKSQGTLFRLSALAVAIISIYPVVHAADITYKDGLTHSVSGGEYDYVEIRHGTPKTLLTALNASNLTINDTRTDNNSGAVFTKGGFIAISDSVINTTGKRSGLQAFSTQDGESPTTVVADKVTINTEGASAHGVFLYFERTPTIDRSDTNLTISGSVISTEGASANGVLVGGVGNSLRKGDGLLTVNNTDIYTGGAAASGVKAQFLGQAVVNKSQIFTTGAGAMGVVADTGGTVVFNGGSINTEDANGVYIKGEGSKVEATDLTINAHGKSNTKAVYVYGAGTVFEATNLTTFSSAATAAKGIVAELGAKATITGGTIETTGGINSHAIDSWEAGSLITLIGVDVKATGYAVAATDGGNVVLTGGVFDVAGTTATTGWDTSVGFLAGGNKSGSQFIADGITLINSVPLNNAPPSETSYALRSGASWDTTTRVVNATMSLSGSEVIASGPQRRIAYIQNSSHLLATDSHLVSEQDAGIVLLNNASVALEGSTLEVAKESFKSSFSESGAEQTISIDGNSVVNKNDGTLLRVDRTLNGKDGVVSLTLQNGSHASGNIRNYDADGNLVAHAETFTTIDVQDGAVWAGIFIDPGTSIVDGDDDKEDFSTGEGEDVAFEGTGGGTQNFNGTTSIGGSASVGRDVSFNGPTTVGGNLSGLDGTSSSVHGPANIGGAVNGGEGASFAFNNSADIGGDVAGAGRSSFSFNGPANIGGGIGGSQGASFSFNGSTSISGDAQGNGSAMTFSGSTNIGGGVSGGNGTSFSFSTTDTTTIGGDVNLDSGSSIGGGSTDAPINIGGDAFAGDGSTLGGNLNVRGSLSGSGGTFAPGNSIGSQTYGSMGEFAGTYAVEINAEGQSDLVTIASGNADLTGIDLTVGQENGNGGYRLYHDYTIVKTGKADGISAVDGNKFASETLDDSFDGTLVKLDPARFGANDVKIRLSINGDALDRTGYSANQNATLDGVLSVAGQNAAADAVMFMQPDARKNALNQLSGELHGSTQAALLQNSSLVSRTLTQRLRGNLGAGMLPGAPTAQAGGSVAGSMPTSVAYPLWAQVVGNWSTLDDDGNAAKVKTHTAGLFVGGDTEVGAGWRVGGALGYTDGRIKVDDRDAKSDVKSYTAALYGGNSWQRGGGKLNLLVGAAYTHHDIDTRRHVNVGRSQTLEADYHAHTTQVFTELGYAMPVGPRSVVEPYAGLAWLGQKAKGFSEEGGAAALQGDSQKDSITTFTLGLRGKTSLNMGKNQAHVFAGLGWRHASGDVDPSRRVSFVQGGGTAFNVAGAPIAKNAAIVDLGIELSVGRNTAMGLGYSGQYGNDNTDHSGQLYLRTRF